MKLTDMVNDEVHKHFKTMVKLADMDVAKSRAEQERDWWKTELRRELACRYSEVRTERVMNIKQVLMEKELEDERTSNKGVETESVGDGSDGVRLGGEGMETREEDLPSLLAKRET